MPIVSCPTCGVAVAAPAPGPGQPAAAPCPECGAAVRVPLAVARPVQAAPAIARAVPVSPPPAGPVTRPRDRAQPTAGRPRRPEPTGLAAVAVPVAGAAGAVLVMVFGAYLAYRVVAGTPELPPDSAGAFAATAGPSPAPRPAAPPVLPGDPFAPAAPPAGADWHPVSEPNAFDGVLPAKGARPRRTTAAVGGSPAPGVVYRATDRGVEYEVGYYDLPAGSGATAREVLDRVGGGGGGPPAEGTLGGRPAAQRAAANGVYTEVIRAAKVGDRVFVAAALIDHMPSVLMQPRGDLDARQRHFFDQFRITHAPAGAPAGPGPAPPPARPRVPPPPAPPAPFPGRSDLPGGEGGLKALARIDPFVAAVALPKRNEVLTFPAAADGGDGKGAVRRYSADTWELLGSADLPHPVVHAAADEKAGRLYVAAATVPGHWADQLPPVGEVQAFDLKQVLADPSPVDTLAPAAAYKLAGGRPTGVEVAPDGKAVYVAVVGAAAGKKAPPVAAQAAATQTRLVKLDPADLREVARVTVPRPVGVLRVAPDGKHVAAAEVLWGPLPGGQDGSTVYVVDAGGWGKPRAVPVPGFVSGVGFLTADRAVAVLAPFAGRPVLYAVGVGGRAAEVTPADGLTVGGALAVLPGGRVVLANLGAGSGTEVVAVGPAGRGRSAARAGLFTQGFLKGPVVATPDGKAVAYASGAVVDVSATAGIKPAADDE